MGMAVKSFDRWIPFYFVLFFVVIAAVDGIFIYLAVSTQTGVVTDRAYENGLAFNEMLARAAKQDRLGIQQHATFKDGILVWDLNNRDGSPLTGARVTAHLFRPVASGHDFTVDVPALTPGRYQTRLALPMHGEWAVRLKAEWNTHQYQTSLIILSP